MPDKIESTPYVSRPRYLIAITPAGTTLTNRDTGELILDVETSIEYQIELPDGNHTDLLGLLRVAGYQV